MINTKVNSQETSSSINHELDFLAGTWNEGDIQEFKNNSTFFESIDKEIWE